MVKEAYEQAYGKPWDAEDLLLPEKYLSPDGQQRIAFPGIEMPVVTIAHPEKIQLYRFGFIPHWTDPDKVGEQRGTFNARIETIRNLATWRDAWKNGQRCLACTTGFFEFNKTEKRKMFIHLKDAEHFYYAGIYNDYINRRSGEVTRSMAVITTLPNERIAAIHNRMPVILPIAEEHIWLDASLSQDELLEKYTRPFTADAMVIEYADDKPAKPEQGKLF